MKLRNQAQVGQQLRIECSIFFLPYFPIMLFAVTLEASGRDHVA